MPDGVGASDQSVTVQAQCLFRVDDHNTSLNLRVARYLHVQQSNYYGWPPSPDEYQSRRLGRYKHLKYRKQRQVDFSLRLSLSAYRPNESRA